MSNLGASALTEGYRLELLHANGSALASQDDNGKEIGQIAASSSHSKEPILIIQDC
jgi:hypothetical protein